MNEYLEPVRYNEGKVDWTLLPWGESVITDLVYCLNVNLNNKDDLLPLLITREVRHILAISLILAEGCNNKVTFTYTTLPWDALEDVCRVLQYGCIKYQRDNYKIAPGLPLEGYIQSMWRHTVSYLKGEDIDIESKLPHLSHLACNCFMYLWTERTYPTK